MDLLYATSNTSKIYNMRRRIKDLPINLLTPYDLNLDLDIVEDGKTPSENALKKAVTYYNATNITTIAGDTALYISKLPSDKQPGLYVKRVNGRTLTNEEIVKHYCDLLNSVGGVSDAYYLTGLAIVSNGLTYTTEIEEDHFILTSKVNDVNKHRGNVLDTMTIDPNCNKYYNEMNDSDFNKLGLIFETKCISFIQEHAIENKQKKL